MQIRLKPQYLHTSASPFKTHKYEFRHFVYEDKQGFDSINPLTKKHFIEFDERV